MSTKSQGYYELSKGMLSEKSQETFLARIGPPTDNGCRIWQGAVFTDGYGAFCVLVDGKKRTLRANRVAFALFVGPVAAGVLIQHSCDTPLCCEGSHLSAGTPLSNMQDKAAKGRGVYPGHPKLTKAQVLSIRVDTRTQRVIAADYGISQSHVSDLKKGKYHGS